MIFPILKNLVFRCVGIVPYAAVFLFVTIISVKASTLAPNDTLLQQMAYSADSISNKFPVDTFSVIPFETYPLIVFPSFSLKYKSPPTKPITFSPSKVSFNTNSPQIKNFRFNLDSVYSDFAILESRYIINNPSKVHFIWSEIPEPSKLLERGFMKRVSANAEMKKYLTDVKEEDKKRITIKKITLSPWKFTGVDYLQLQQVGYSNWAQGGENNLTLSNDLRLKLKYKMDKSEWESFLISKIGLNYTAKEATNVNDDQFEINTKYGYKASKRWYYSASLNLKTQLFYDSDEDSNGKITYNSGFLSPGYFTMALGMDYKTDKGFSLLIAPLTSKIVFVTDTINIDQTNFGIERGSKSHRQTGFGIVNFHKIPFTTLIIYSGRVEIFMDYLTSKNRWLLETEHILDLRINRYLTSRIIFEFKYLEAEIEGLQFKENILIGFTYTI